MPWFERPKDPRQGNSDRDPRKGNQQQRTDQQPQRNRFGFGVSRESQKDQPKKDTPPLCRFSTSGSDETARSRSITEVKPTSLIRRRIDVACLNCSTRTHFNGEDANEKLLDQRFKGLVAKWIEATVASCHRSLRSN